MHIFWASVNVFSKGKMYLLSVTLIVSNLLNHVFSLLKFSVCYGHVLIYKGRVQSVRAIESCALFNTDLYVYIITSCDVRHVKYMKWTIRMFKYL